MGNLHLKDIKNVEHLGMLHQKFSRRNTTIKKLIFFLWASFSIFLSMVKCLLKVKIRRIYWKQMKKEKLISEQSKIYVEIYLKETIMQENLNFWHWVNEKYALKRSHEKIFFHLSDESSLVHQNERQRGIKTK
jgi:hypothetical protein